MALLVNLLGSSPGKTLHFQCEALGYESRETRVKKIKNKSYLTLAFVHTVD